ncbi:MAG: hypothetical protein ACLPXU_01355 [Acidimicrobiales bacterium]|jgi:hypothetical protein
MGWAAVHADSFVEEATPKLAFRAGEEATMKACGVIVARLQGNSWTPTPSTGTQ